MSNDRPVPLFYNPTAGRGRAAARIRKVSELLTGKGIGNEPIASRAKGDLENRVMDAIGEGHDRILVAGGDGSVHEAVNAVMRTGRNAALGVIPVGTGNDFARASSIPQHWEHATELLADRMASGALPLAVDVGRCNDRYFANGAGIGLDASVAYLAERIRLPIGDAVYLIALVRTVLQGLATPSMTIRFDETTLEGPVLLANVANGGWEGGMFYIAPGADNSDGWLDLVTAAPVSVWRLFRLLPKLARGTHLEADEVQHYRLRRCTVECAEPVIAHFDGELQEPQLRFDIELLPGALRML